MVVAPLKAPDTFPVPLKLCLQRVRDVANLVADEAFPDRVALIVDGSFRFTFPEPFTETTTAVPVPSLLTIPIFLAVPQFAVVILAVPVKEVPLIVLVVCSLVADPAFPDILALEVM